MGRRGYTTTLTLHGSRHGERRGKADSDKEGEEVAGLLSKPANRDKHSQPKIKNGYSAYTANCDCPARMDHQNNILSDGLYTVDGSESVPPGVEFSPCVDSVPWTKETDNSGGGFALNQASRHRSGSSKQMVATSTFGRSPAIRPLTGQPRECTSRRRGSYG